MLHKHHIPYSPSLILTIIALPSIRNIAIIINYDKEGRTAPCRHQDSLLLRTTRTYEGLLLTHRTIQPMHRALPTAAQRSTWGVSELMWKNIRSVCTDIEESIREQQGEVRYGSPRITLLQKKSTTWSARLVLRSLRYVLWRVYWQRHHA